MVQKTYALLVDRLSLGADALMLESPISASISPLTVTNDNDVEVLKIPVMTALDVPMNPKSACTDLNMKIISGNETKLSIIKLFTSTSIRALDPLSRRDWNRTLLFKSPTRWAVLGTSVSNFLIKSGEDSGEDSGKITFVAKCNQSFGSRRYGHSGVYLYHALCIQHIHTITNSSSYSRRSQHRSLRPFEGSGTRWLDHERPPGSSWQQFLQSQHLGLVEEKSRSRRCQPTLGHVKLTEELRLKWEDPMWLQPWA